MSMLTHTHIHNYTQEILLYTSTHTKKRKHNVANNYIQSHNHKHSTNTHIPIHTHTHTHSPTHTGTLTNGHKTTLAPLTLNTTTHTRTVTHTNTCTHSHTCTLTVTHTLTHQHTFTPTHTHIHTLQFIELKRTHTHSQANSHTI